MQQSLEMDSYVIYLLVKWSKSASFRKIVLAGFVSQPCLIYTLNNYLISADRYKQADPISIFWVHELAYASGSNRCNKPAWIHRA